MKIVREGREVLHDRFVTPDQPVVGEHRRNRDDEAEGGHDECFTDRAGHRIDRRLARCTDPDQSAVDTDNGTEQTDEWSSRTDRRKEGQTFTKTGADSTLATGEAVGHPVVLVDRIGQAAVLVLCKQSVVDD